MTTIVELARKVQPGEAPPPPIGRLLGFVLKQIEPGRAVFEMKVDERHHNPMGTLHGGVYCDLADAAMGYAYAATLTEGESFTTVKLKINFLRPVRHGKLTAEAKVVKAGSALSCVECDVTNQSGKLVARASSTYLHETAAEPPANGVAPVPICRRKPDDDETLSDPADLPGGAVRGGLLGAVVSGRLGEQRREEKGMSHNQFTGDQVRRTTDKPFGDVTTAFERQLGRFEPGVYQALAAGGDAEGARAKIEAMAGPSGFMLFGTQDHGSLLRLAGRKRKAVQYVVGNPLFALQMTQHDIRAGLYAPLRVLVYEDGQGQTCVEYDRSSSLFGQFGDDRIAPTAATLDRKLKALVAASLK